MGSCIAGEPVLSAQLPCCSLALDSMDLQTSSITSVRTLQQPQSPPASATIKPIMQLADCTFCQGFLSDEV